MGALDGMQVNGPLNGPHRSSDAQMRLQKLLLRMGAAGLVCGVLLIAVTIAKLPQGRVTAYPVAPSGQQLVVSAPAGWTPPDAEVFFGAATRPTGKCTFTIAKGTIVNPTRLGRPETVELNGVTYFVQGWITKLESGDGFSCPGVDPKQLMIAADGRADTQVQGALGFGAAAVLLVVSAAILLARHPLSRFLAGMGFKGKQWGGF